MCQDARSTSNEENITTYELRMYWLTTNQFEYISGVGDAKSTKRTNRWLYSSDRKFNISADKLYQCRYLIRSTTHQLTDYINNK